MRRPIKSSRIKLRSLLVMLMIMGAQAVMASTWTHLSTGLSYQDLSKTPLTPWAHIHAFRIDPKRYALDWVTARELGQQHASIEEFAHFSKALLAINGGFFDQKYRPLGLRVHHKKERNPLKRISWWGVFLMKNKMPYLISSREYATDPQIDFAVQSGPRLIIDGAIPRLRPGIAERSALGITQNNKIIILVTDKALLTTTELARLMQSPPLSCSNALNLDGGSSSQLMANIGSLQLNVHGFSDVGDAIVLKRL